MPADHCLRANQQEMVAPPAGPQVMEPDPEDAVGVSEARPGIVPENDLKLVAKHEVLEGEVLVRAEQGKDGSEGEEKQPKHPAGYHRRGRHPDRSCIQIPICRPSPGRKGTSMSLSSPSR